MRTDAVHHQLDLLVGSLQLADDLVRIAHGGNLRHRDDYRPIRANDGCLIALLNARRAIDQDIIKLILHRLDNIEHLLRFDGRLVGDLRSRKQEKVRVLLMPHERLPIIHSLLYHVYQRIDDTPLQP